MAFWYISGAFLKGSQGILSYALSLVEDVGGLRGWRWIFIVPGFLTAAIAVPIYHFMNESLVEINWQPKMPLDFIAVKQQISSVVLL